MKTAKPICQRKGFARITIEHANGECDSFTVKGRVAGWVADSLAITGHPWKAKISIVANGSTFDLEPIEGRCPVWHPRESEGKFDRNSALLEV